MYVIPNMEEDNFFGQIRQAEEDMYRMSTGNPVSVTIQITSYLAADKEINIDKPTKTFRPSIFFKAGLTTLIVGIFVFAIYALNRKSTHINVGGMLVVFVAFIIIMINAIRQFFFDKSLNYTIKIDYTGICIDDTLYAWKDIYGTAIMSVPTSKSPTKYLIIALNDLGTYEKYELTNFGSWNFGGFSETLSNYIEY